MKKTREQEMAEARAHPPGVLHASKTEYVVKLWREASGPWIDHPALAPFACCAVARLAMHDRKTEGVHLKVVQRYTYVREIDV